MEPTHHSGQTDDEGHEAGAPSGPSSVGIHAADRLDGYAHDGRVAGRKRLPGPDDGEGVKQEEFGGPVHGVRAKAPDQALEEKGHAPGDDDTDDEASTPLTEALVPSKPGHS
jgi:hypothetical protein